MAVQRIASSWRYVESSCANIIAQQTPPPFDLPCWRRCVEPGSWPSWCCAAWSTGSWCGRWSRDLLSCREVLLAKPHWPNAFPLMVFLSIVSKILVRKHNNQVPFQMISASPHTSILFSPGLSSRNSHHLGFSSLSISQFVPSSTPEVSTVWGTGGFSFLHLVLNGLCKSLGWCWEVLGSFSLWSSPKMTIVFKQIILLESEQCPCKWQPPSLNPHVPFTPHRLAFPLQRLPWGARRLPNVALFLRSEELSQIHCKMGETSLA